MFRTTPKEERFFDMFIETAGKSCEAAVLLNDLVNNYEDINKKIDDIEQIEHECDQCCHDIIELLNKSFITPIDREDIDEIVKVLDNITDSIEATAHRFRMLNVKTITDETKVVTKLIVDCTTELQGVMMELKHMKTSKTLYKKIIEVNRIEDEGDDIFRDAITSLFRDNPDPIDIIKWKEIYELLENSLDACEDVANIVEGIVMKHV